MSSSNYFVDVNTFWLCVVYREMIVLDSLQNPYDSEDSGPLFLS